MSQEQFLETSRKNRSFRDFPCQREKQLVDQCYSRTNYDINACAAVIENYKTCKHFWGKVETARRAAGVKPSKPDAEEREKIKAYYRKHKRLPKFSPEQPAT